MCEIKFLQMCSFYIIFTSLYSLNLSFPLLFCVIICDISIAIIKFPPWFAALPPWFHTFFCISTHIPHIHHHYYPIPRISTLILRISLIPFLSFP